MPFRGSLVLLLAACACCVLTGIGIGTFVATLSRSATQAQLMLFFVNPPLMALSGGFTPIEAMPKWIQPLTHLNPIAHFANLARSVMVRGAGVDVVYVQLLALGIIATLLVGFSASRFRSQMS
jgi:ABC-2 type transport system permease protein